MSQARVDDLDALKRFKLALLKFQEAAMVALADAEGDFTRTMLWLEVEQAPFWDAQVRKRQLALSQAQERLRMKKVFKDVVGSKPSTIDEEKAVKVAMARLEEANQKVANVKLWKRRMEKIGHDYKGSAQRLQTTVSASLPATTAALEGMIRQLELYIGLRPAEVASEAGPAAGVGGGFAGVENADSMARGVVDEPPVRAAEPPTSAPARPAGVDEPPAADQQSGDQASGSAAPGEAKPQE